MLKKSKKSSNVFYKYGNKTLSRIQNDDSIHAGIQYGEKLLQPEKHIDRLTRQEYINPDFVQEYGNPYNNEKDQYNPSVIRSREDIELDRMPKKQIRSTKEIMEEFFRNQKYINPQKVYISEEQFYSREFKKCGNCEYMNHESIQECEVCGYYCFWDFMSVLTE